jgi:hypothetical protein
MQFLARYLDLGAIKYVRIASMLPFMLPSNAVRILTVPHAPPPPPTICSYYE